MNMNSKNSTHPTRRARGRGWRQKAVATTAALITALLFLPATVSAQNAWTGFGLTDNWSDTGNWQFGVVPDSTMSVLFDYGSIWPGVANGVVDNIVDQDFTIGGFRYQTVSTNVYHTTLIDAPQSLNITGSGGDAIYVGTGLSQGSGQNVYSRIVGSGTLTVTNTSGAIRVMQFGANNDHLATLDLSGLSNFVADVGQVLISTTTTANEQYMMGTLTLAQTNFVRVAPGTTKPGILVGSMNNASTGKRGTQQILLGPDNTIEADTISIGGTKMDGAIQFRSGLTAGAKVTLRGSAGGSDPVKVLAVGDHRASPLHYLAGGTSVGVTGTLNTTGGWLDALITDLYVARSQTNSGGTTTGTLTFDQGTVVVDNLRVGFHLDGLPPSGQAANATGTVNVNGNATLTVNNDLLLARKLGTNTPSGTLNVASNATVNVKGNLLTGGGNGTLNVNGLVDLQPAGDATPGFVSVGTLTGSGIITNASAITNTSVLNPGGTVTPATLVLDGSLTLANNATLTVNLSNSPSGANDLVKVTGDLNLNDNGLTIVPLSGTFAVGSYPLIEYSGTRSGTLAFTNPTRYNLALDYPANQVALDVLGGAPGTVRWNSTASAAWDLTTSNWFNTGSAATDKFFQLDEVVVDDSGAYTNLLLLSTALYPSQVTVNSSTRDYAFGGSGRIGGGASIVKNGTSTLAISNANDFTGPVTVNGGTLRLANNAALGTSAGGLTINPGATLDVGGAYSAGLDLVTIAGTGLNNTGAVINSGARSDNAIRLLALAGDATVGTYGAGRWDVRGAGGNSSFSGMVDLGGYTLTSIGATQFSIVDSICTNPGNLFVAGGTLSLTRSKVEGAGTINVSSNNLFFENYVTGYVTKPIIVDGGLIKMSGATFSLGSPITNGAGGVRIDVANPLTLTNIVSGPGGVTKLGGSSLTYEAVNPYSGPTIVSAGQLILGTNAALPATPEIALANNTIFNVSALPSGFSLASGQTLSGNGSVVGDVTAGLGTFVTPGVSAGTLNFSNNLTLNSASLTMELGSDPFTIGGGVNDLIAVGGNLNLGGVTAIKVAPLATLDTANPYTLFTYAGSLSGGAANLSVSSDSRYSFTLVDPTTTFGSIQVQVSGSGASANLVWQGNHPINPTYWDTKVTANWLNGAVSDVFYVGDNVAFDDTAATTTVNLIGTIQAATVGVTNTSKNYTLGGAGSLLAGSLTKEGTGSLVITGSGENTISAVALFNDGTTTFSNSGGNTFASGVTVNYGTLTFANAVPNNFLGPLTINGGSVVFNQPVDVTLSAQLTDGGFGGQLEKKNNNVLTLSGNNNTFNGPILVSAGTLRAQNNNALGTATLGTTIASGATLDINGYSLYNPGEVITISGNGVGGRGAILNDSPNAQQNAVRAIELAGNAAIGAPNLRWDIRGNLGSGTFSGLVNLNNFTLTKVGPGRISIVDCDVTSGGSIDLLEGMLAMTRNNVDGLGTINIRTNLLMLENYGSGYINKPILSSGGTLQLVGNTFSLGAPITNLGGLTADIASGLTLTATATITGPGALTKANSGTLALGAFDNDWSGGTIINGGTLQVGTGYANFDGSLPDRPIQNNASLWFLGLNSFTNSAGISGTGTLTKRGDGVLTLTSSNSFTGNVITGTGDNSVGSGGKLVIRNSYALGNTNKTVSIVRAELILEGPLTIPPELAFVTSANSDVATAGAGLVAFRNASGNNVIQGPITLTSGAGSSEYVVDAGQLTLNGDISPDTTARVLILSGAGPGIINGAVTNRGTNIPAVEKRGDGTWTLNAANTYTGSTTVKGGTLALGPTASIGGSTPIDVQTNATLNVAAVTGGFVLQSEQVLKGEGTVVGNVTANGTVSPGASIGKLTFANNLVLAGTNLMEIDRTNTPNADLLVSASTTFGGVLLVTNIGEELQVGDTFNLFDGPFTGTFAEIVLPTLEPGRAWDVSKLYVDGTIQVVVSVSTEPTSLSYFISGNALDISWPSTHIGWTLLSQTNTLNVGLSNNWFPVSGSEATNRVILPINPANGSVFLRLVYTNAP